MCLRVGVGVGVRVCASILLMRGLASTTAYRAFLDKLEICIECVDLVYTDPAGTLGVHIDAITLVNEAPTPSDESEHTIKSASISNLNVFIDPNATSDHAIPPSGGHRDVGGGEGGSDGSEHTHFLLRPCSATMRVSYDTPTASRNLSRPRVSVAARIVSGMQTSVGLFCSLVGLFLGLF